MRLEYFRREEVPGAPVPEVLHAVRLLDARDFFFPTGQINEIEIARFCSDCLRNPNSFFKRSTACPPPSFLHKPTSAVGSRLVLTKENSIVVSRITQLALRDRRMPYVLTLRESYFLRYDGVSTECRLILTPSSKFSFLDRRKWELPVVSSVELAKRLPVELQSGKTASEIQAIFEKSCASLGESLSKIPINRWTYKSKKDRHEYPIPWIGQIPSEFYNDLKDLTGKWPVLSPQLNTLPYARMEWSSKSPHVAKSAETASSGSTQPTRQSTSRSGPAKTSAPAVFRYKNAPQKAVDDCVKALQRGGLKCTPSTFEADIDRIITAEMMARSVISQMSEMPRETSEKLTQILGTEFSATFDANSKAAKIISSTLGPWLS